MVLLMPPRDLELEGFRLHLEPLVLELVKLLIGQRVEHDLDVFALEPADVQDRGLDVGDLERVKFDEGHAAEVESALLAIALVQSALEPADPRFHALPDRQVPVAGADQQGRQVLLFDSAQGPAELADQDGKLGGSASSDRPHAGHGQHPVGFAFHRQEKGRAEVAAEQSAFGILSQDQLGR